MTRRPSRKVPAGSREGQIPSETVGEVVPPLAPSEPENLASMIRVELNDVIDGWPTNARFDVVLRGQITSTSPVDTLSIRDPAGIELTTIQFGQGDAQETVTLESGESGSRVGFQLYLPLPGGDEIRIADMWLRAQARDGA